MKQIIRSGKFIWRRNGADGDKLFFFLTNGPFHFDFVYMKTSTSTHVTHWKFPASSAYIYHFAFLRLQQSCRLLHGDFDGHRYSFVRIAHNYFNNLVLLAHFKSFPSLLTCTAEILTLNRAWQNSETIDGFVQKNISCFMASIAAWIVAQRSTWRFLQVNAMIKYI